MNLYEKYRPKNWSEVVGHSAIIKSLQKLESKQGFGGKSFWISGNSGTGKTTIARIIASKIATPLFVTEIDSKEMTTDFIKEMYDEMQYYAWCEDSKRGKAFIVNEAHGLRADAINKLLVLLEKIPAHCVVIFTTTKQGEKDFFENKLDACPLLSRCIELSLEMRNITQLFADRLKQIAISENLDGQDIKNYIQLLRDKRNNMRACLQDIEMGKMTI